MTTAAMHSPTPYYSLRRERTGEQVWAAAEELTIGQRSTDNVRYANRSPYVDALYAVVRPNKQSPGTWTLTPASPYVRTTVNGSPVDIVHYLRTGDLIAFEGETEALRFTVHTDRRYSSDMGTLHVQASLAPRTRGLLVGALVLILIAIGALVYLDRLRHTAEQRITEALAAIDGSLYRLRVDSVYYVRIATASDGTTHVDTLRRAAYNVSGTAFLTTDSLLVTARHCLQPWLNDTDLHRATRPGDLTDGPGRWAFEAETHNQIGDTTYQYRLYTLCTLLKGLTGNQRIDTICSSRFHMDYTTDELIETGDRTHSYYRRSISRRGMLTTPMLGDVAYAHMDRAGKIDRANAADMQDLAVRTRIYCKGYPTDYSDIRLTTQEGRLTEAYREGEMLSIDAADVTTGFSGGPVLTVTDSKIGAPMVRVVGIVSVVDNQSVNRNDRIYCVPITRIHKAGF